MVRSGCSNCLGFGYNAMIDNIPWFSEKIERLKRTNWLYRAICFFLMKRRLTYRDMFLLLYGINKRHLGEKRAKTKALERVLLIYKENNGHYPEGVQKKQ